MLSLCPPLWVCCVESATIPSAGHSNPVTVGGRRVPEGGTQPSSGRHFSRWALTSGWLSRDLRSLQLSRPAFPLLCAEFHVTSPDLTFSLLIFCQLLTLLFQRSWIFLVDFHHLLNFNFLISSNILYVIVLYLHLKIPIRISSGSKPAFGVWWFASQGPDSTGNWVLFPESLGSFSREEDSTHHCVHCGPFKGPSFL